MKISSLLFPLLLLLLPSGDDFGPSLGVNFVHGARIPEHTCHKLIEMKKCEIEICNQGCSEFPDAVGECKQNICFCTYFCKDPPM